MTDLTGQRLLLRDGSNAIRVKADENGYIYGYNAEGKSAYTLSSNDSFLSVGREGQHGAVLVLNAAGQRAITITGETGDIILNNADAAEDFYVVAAHNVLPGTVLVIDDEEQLVVSDLEYDKKVAGVVSGAGGYRPGIVLDRHGPSIDRLPVALMGKVFVNADAEPAPIGVGDLLTTSSRPGHAMKASDSSRAFGAVIGKALGALESGQGQIPILVSLQ